MPYLVHLSIVRRLAEWQMRLDRLGEYLAGRLPAQTAPKQKKS